MIFPVATPIQLGSSYIVNVQQKTLISFFPCFPSIPPPFLLAVIPCKSRQATVLRNSVNTPPRPTNDDQGSSDFSNKQSNDLHLCKKISFWQSSSPGAQENVKRIKFQLHFAIKGRRKENSRVLWGVSKICAQSSPSDCPLAVLCLRFEKETQKNQKRFANSQV